MTNTNVTMMINTKSTTTNATNQKTVQKRPTAVSNLRPANLNRNRSMAHVRLSFFGSIRSELLKLFSIASTLWLSAISFLTALGFSALFAWGIKQESHYNDKGKWMAMARPIPRSIVLECVSQSLAIGIVLIGVVAILSITGEYTTSSVQMSLVVNPRRVMFMNAKAVAVAIYSFTLSLVTLLISWGVVEVLFAGSKQTPLGSKERWLPLIVILGGAAMTTLVTEFALGLGAMVRSTAGAVVIFVVIYMMATSIFGIISNLSRHMLWANWCSRLMPSSLVNTFLTGRAAEIEAGMVPKGWPVPGWWQSGLIMLAWTVVFYVIGTLLVSKRDVK
ncbi:ABC transporter permease subunit [Bifidobacterium sp. ESL0775]|uniref:ABC transporter permease subunit n=1 Tax=Bifidobacterium sp. ESL0775 TaxID=2983230 RepID=UPI0023F745B4|nr:ABC transporter permease subunit [Bifidobacterium sp. ESL0775]WEV69186.1 ABC transporter permease subunit [Bifidobacterium sp. ESL0775]